jgi:hypothetical protein
MFPFGNRPILPPPPPPTEQELADQREHKAASDAYIEAVRARNQAYIDKLAAAEKERQDRDRDAAAERNRRREEQHAAAVAADMEWGRRRNEMREAVADLRRQVDGLQGRVDRADLADAIAAAGELAVLSRRLELAEAELAQYLRNAPRPAF